MRTSTTPFRRVVATVVGALAALLLVACTEAPDPVIGVPSPLPITGTGSSELDPLLRAMEDFMRHRCVGAAILGVSLHGQPVGVWGLGRMQGRAADGWDPECGDDTSQPLAAPVPADTPMRLGSISKPVTVAMTRWAIKTVAQQSLGITLSDDQVEAIKLFDPAHDPPLIPGTSDSFPVSLVPRDIYLLFSGQMPFPIAVPDGFGFGGDEDDGDVLCGDLTSGFADPQWQDVTLGHLFGHRSGLQPSAPNSTQWVVPNLPTIRSLGSFTTFLAQEQQLRQRWGDAAVDGARAQLGFGADDGFMIPGPTLAETLSVVAGRCLRYPLGQNSYSNTSPAFSTLVLYELMASGRLAAEVGEPATHTGSALDIFFQSQLGVTTTGNSGVFLSLATGGMPGYPDREPAKRHWGAGTYDGTAWDTKRPHCEWTGSTCDFSAWRTADPGRINWAWQLSEVPFAATLTGVSPGTGSLAAEAETFLRFMAEYWVNEGSGATPGGPHIGERRNGDVSRYAWHGGAFNGARAFALQIGTVGKPTSRNLPPINASGRITDDFGNLSSVSLSLPDGLDIFVAVNQRRDRKCTLAEQSKVYTCNAAYNILPSFLFYGASQVDWSVVEPPPDLIVIAP